MLDREITAARVDPRTKRTRQLLLDAFGKLLTEKSFEDITVQDISERATVNRATFYAHFEDKYVLLDQSMAEMIQHALHQKLPPDSQFTAANVERLIETVCEFLDKLQSHCAPSNRNQFASLVEQQVKQQLYAIILHWLEENNSPRTMQHKQAELQATVTSWAIYGAAMRWSTGDRSETAAAFARQALPLIMAGLNLPSDSSSKTRATVRR